MGCSIKKVSGALCSARSTLGAHHGVDFKAPHGQRVLLAGAGRGITSCRNTPRVHPAICFHQTEPHRPGRPQILLAVCRKVRRTYIKDKAMAKSKSTQTSRAAASRIASATAKQHGQIPSNSHASRADAAVQQREAAQKKAAS
jgi:hypothetical protein